MENIAVIGGGPAGMAAAIAAASQDHGLAQICLFERNGRPGKKLLLSGAGQCNITHTGEIEDFLGCFPANQASFLKPAFYGFFRRELFDLLGVEGLRFAARPDGKYFPESGLASDVLAALERLLRKNRVRQRFGKTVLGITRGESGFSVILAGGEEAGPWDAVVLAGGGKSYPGTGSDGSVCCLAEALGHHIVPLRPALADICIKDFYLAGCMGVSFADARLSLFKGGKKPVCRSGDLLVTHKGFSGPLVINNSFEMEAGDRIQLDFWPLSADFDTDWQKYAADHGARMLKTFLASIGIAESFAQKVLTRHALDPVKKMAEISRAERMQVKKLFTAAEFVIAEAGSFRNAMLTAGGVSLADVNRQTMESRFVPGLYFAGEMLDINGPTGGYNLQAAFSTGFLAGKSCRTGP